MGSRKSKVSRADGRRAAICVILAWTGATLFFGGCRRPGSAVRIENEALASTAQEVTVKEEAVDLGMASETGAEPAAKPSSEGMTVFAPAEKIYVHVCGQVRDPGVYELWEGSRVADAVEAAGGFCPEAASEAVNLAAHVADGSKIVIPSREEAAAFPSEEAASNWYEEESRPAEPESGGGGNTQININEASADQLTAIPGIGQTRAEAIVAYREANGLFGTIEDIMKVTGIKDGLFGKIKDYITVGG